MSDGLQVSSLPLPPMQYVNLYSEENIKRGRSLKPPYPSHDTYSVFGLPISNDDVIIRPLENQGYKRLYPQNFDHKKELKKLNHSILVNFMDLLDLLIKSPDSPKREEKLEDLSLLFINMHHLINEYRPHQARETLRVMLEVQKKDRQEISERFNKHLERSQEVLQEALAALPDNYDIDKELLISTENLNVHDEVMNNNDTCEPCSKLDKLMCEIVDAL